ncbi:helix-turn-helix transcriptional regulator [Leucobacter sp. W1478]|uniref:helix-turn-helix transcriptional regulator n=1 Tax=Leucobacter sp. W1478 TaxID=3439065 RepID=UPI003F36F9B9
MVRGLNTPDRVVLLLALVPYLVERGPTPLAELAKAFDVEERVLRKLIPFLGMAGVPGETNTYQHEDLFDIDWDAFEEHDVVTLTRVIAVDNTPRFSAIETAVLIAGLQALLPMLPPQEQRHAVSASAKLGSGLAHRQQVSLSVSTEPTAPGRFEISTAIASGKQLSFAYRDAQGNETVRHVEPLVLGQAHGEWYLRAHCLDRNAERTFSVDRIRDAQMLPDDARTRPTGRASLPKLDPVREGLVARVRFRVGVLHRLAGFVPRLLGEPDNGWVRAEIDLAHPAVAVRVVQVAPGEIIIESPDSARDAVREWADRALAPHDA